MRTLFEIFTHELRAALRTRRFIVTAVVFVVLAALGAFTTFIGIRATQEVVISELVATGMNEAAAIEVVASQGANAAESVFENVGPGWSQFAAPLRLSLVVPVFLLMALWFMPWAILAASADLFASDLRARTLTFWSMRVPRSTLVVARIAAQSVVIVSSTLLMGVVTTVIGALALHGFALHRALAGFGYATLMILPYAVTIIAITAWASAGTRSTVGAFARAFGAVVLLALCGAPQHVFDEDSPFYVLRHARVLNPGWWADGLWAADLGVLAPTLLAYAAFVVAFTLLAIWRLGRQDL